jgi:hypothetical protein
MNQRHALDRLDPVFPTIAANGSNNKACLALDVGMIAGKTGIVGGVMKRRRYRCRID